MRDIEQRLIQAGLEAPPVAAPPAGAQQLMVSINTPNGPQEVPVEIGIFLLLDTINANIIALTQSLTVGSETSEADA